MTTPPDVVVVPLGLWLELGRALGEARLAVLGIGPWVDAAADGDRLRSRVQGPIERAYGIVVDVSASQDHVARPGA